MVAAALLGEPATGEQASRLLASAWDLTAPSHWRAEFANVVWKTVRQGRLDIERVDGILAAAEALPIAPVETSELWRGAVARAITVDHPVYDVLFVELAIRLGTQVASYDRQLRARFPEHVRRPADLLHAR